MLHIVALATLPIGQVRDELIHLVGIGYPTQTTSANIQPSIDGAVHVISSCKMLSKNGNLPHFLPLNEIRLLLSQTEQLTPRRIELT